MITAWGRLQGWIEQDRAGLVVRQRLAEDARTWQRSGRQGDYLYRRAQLEPVRQWTVGHPNDLMPLEAAFVAGSERAQRLERLRRLAVVVTLLLVPIIITWFLMSTFRVGPLAPSEIAFSTVDALLGEDVVSVISTADGRLLVGRGDAPQIAVSDDSGHTWRRTDVKGTYVQVIEADPLHSGVYHVLLDDGGVQRSQDGGLTWSSRSVHPDQLDWRALTVGSDGALYAGGRASPVWVSRDAGETWTWLEGSPDATISYLTWQDNGLYVGTLKGLWRWTEPGNWQRLLGDEAKAVYSVVVDEDVGFSGGNSGVYRFDQNGQATQLSMIPVQYIVKLQSGADLVFLAGTSAGGLVWWRRDDEQVHSVAITEQLAGSDVVQHIVVDAEDPRWIWVGTIRGLFHGQVDAWIDDLD